MRRGARWEAGDGAGAQASGRAGYTLVRPADVGEPAKERVVDAVPNHEDGLADEEGAGGDVELGLKELLSRAVSPPRRVRPSSGRGGSADNAKLAELLLHLTT
jgi:hypothetical protein